MATPRLNIAIADYGHTRALKSGEVAIEGGGSKERSHARSRLLESSQHGIGLRLELQQFSDHAGDSLPVLGFGDELFAAGFRNGIKPGLAIIFGQAPL